MVDLMRPKETFRDFFCFSEVPKFCLKIEKKNIYLKIFQNNEVKIQNFIIFYDIINKSFSLFFHLKNRNI